MSTSSNRFRRPQTGHAFTAENLPLDETKTFGFQPDTYRRSWQAMTDFLAEALS